jgi:hypothetical protein
MTTKVDLMNDRYEIVRKLGEGGEAEVYLVKDRNENNTE